MTTEDAIQRHLDAHPDDHTARLALADFLEENAGETDCRECGGKGCNRDGPDYNRTRERCDACARTGRVPDGRRERAAGYRALAALNHRPSQTAVFGRPEWTWWSAESYQSHGPEYLPDDWMKLVWAAVRETNRRDAYHEAWAEFDTRREAEDAAARAFAALPADRRRELLTPAETPA